MKTSGNDGCNLERKVTKKHSRKVGGKPERKVGMKTCYAQSWQKMVGFNLLNFLV